MKMQQHFSNPLFIKGGKATWVLGGHLLQHQLALHFCGIKGRELKTGDNKVLLLKFTSLKGRSVIAELIGLA